MAIVHPAKLPKLHRDLTDALSEGLKGTPLLDANDRAILDESGKVIYRRPDAAFLKVVREFLKDNGIESEPIEGSPVESVAKQLTHFEGDPLFLEEPESLPEESLPE